LISLRCQLSCSRRGPRLDHLNLPKAAQSRHVPEEGRLLPVWLQQGDAQGWATNLQHQTRKPGTGAHVQERSLVWQERDGDEAVEQELMDDPLTGLEAGQINLCVPAGELIQKNTQTLDRGRWEDYTEAVCEASDRFAFIVSCAQRTTLRLIMATASPGVSTTLRRSRSDSEMVFSLTNVFFSQSRSPAQKSEPMRITGKDRIRLV
jgi:hypothetical protein